MYVKSITSMPIFKANAPKYPNLPSEADLGTMLREQGNIDFSMVDKSTNETLFQAIVDANYTKLLAYMIAKEIDLSNVANIPNSQGRYPLETAQSSEMSILIKRAGGVMPTEDSVISPVPAEDARVVAAKQYMTKSVMEKIEENTVEKAPKSSVINYFDVFEEVSDDEPPSSEGTMTVIKAETKAVKADVPKTAEADVPKAAGAEVPKAINASPNKLNIKGLEDFKRLIITDNDVLTIDDLIGREDIKSELKTNVIAPLKDNNVSQKLKENKIDIPNGILFAANGGGELTIIKALSNEAEIPAIIMENPQDLEQIIIAVEARYKNTGLKTIILAQGFDKYFSNCTTCDNTKANTFRNKIRGIKEKGGLFIATTSDKKLIREDFMQSGIIDKVFDVPKPNASDRTEFLKRYFKDKEIFKDVNNEEAIQKMVVLTDNRSYSDMLRVLDETARTALANGKNADLQTFEEQIKDFSQELGIVPITEENRTASYDTPEFKRVPIEKGEMMSLDELGGMPEVKARLRELYVEPMKNLDELLEIFGNDAIPDGAIFYGPAGNGKTLTARVLARELGLPFYETRLSDFGTAYVHESGKKFKQYADQLDKKFKETGERSVWFLDEFESMGASRNGNGYSDKELTDALLQELNNPAQRGFIVIAATNNLDDVDSALKRRDRLGNWIEFKNPNQEEREDAIKKHLLKHEFTKDFASNSELVTNIATELDGFSMSSIAFSCIFCENNCLLFTKSTNCICPIISRIFPSSIC